MQQNTVHTLWTGGLDSTARVVYLSRQEDITIQPYYVLDTARVSANIELETMKKISKRLREDPGTKAELRDVIIINTSDISPNEQITTAWRRLNYKYGVGSQYDFLARYANQHDITLEIGIEKGDGRAQTAILTDSEMVPVKCAFGGG